jgi:hypothetical protein
MAPATPNVKAARNALREQCGTYLILVLAQRELKFISPRRILAARHQSKLAEEVASNVTEDPMPPSAQLNFKSAILLEYSEGMVAILQTPAVGKGHFLVSGVADHGRSGEFGIFEAVAQITRAIPSIERRQWPRSGNRRTAATNDKARRQPGFVHLATCPTGFILARQTLLFPIIIITTASRAPPMT